MRSDMKKLLCERERSRSTARGIKTSIQTIRKYDENEEYDYPVRASSSRGHHLNCKELSDFLSPLRGYLRSRVGDHWDDIWSELCQNLDRRSVTGNHVFEHIKWEVETKTVLGKDGEVHRSEWKRGYRAGDLVDGLYVHPITGVLCYKEPVSWRSRWKAKKRKFRGDFLWREEGKHDQAFVKVNGLWFLVTYVPLGRDHAPPAAYKQLNPRLTFSVRQRVDEDTRYYWPSRWLVIEEKKGSTYVWLETIRKKSLNKKEIGELKLRIQKHEAVAGRRAGSR